jgi:hypothetical protein
MNAETKIIQIFAVTPTIGQSEMLYALDTEGRVWRMAMCEDSQWEQLNLPDTEIQGDKTGAHEIKMDRAIRKARKFYFSLHPNNTTLASIFNHLLTVNNTYTVIPELYAWRETIPSYDNWK